MTRKTAPSSSTSSSSTRTVPRCSTVFATYPSRVKRARSEESTASSGSRIHGDAIPIPVRRGVHDGHPAHAEDAIEFVLPLQRRADAEASPRREFFVAHLLPPPVGEDLSLCDAETPGATTVEPPVSRRHAATARDTGEYYAIIVTF